MGVILSSPTLTESLRTPHYPSISQMSVLIQLLLKPKSNGKTLHGIRKGEHYNQISILENSLNAQKEKLRESKN